MKNTWSILLKTWEIVWFICQWSCNIFINFKELFTLSNSLRCCWKVCFVLFHVESDICPRNRPETLGGIWCFCSEQSVCWQETMFLMQIRYWLRARKKDTRPQNKKRNGLEQNQHPAQGLLINHIPATWLAVSHSPARVCACVCWRVCVLVWDIPLAS